MAFCRRSFLILFALILSGGPLFASSREDRAYAAACGEFQDKFYDRAEADFTQFLDHYRKSTNAPQATLLLAQSEFYLGKYPEAVARLTDTNNLSRAGAMLDRYIYWTGEAQFATGDLNGAANTFVSLTVEFPRSPLAVNSAVEAAAAYEKLGDWSKVDEVLSDTNGVFQKAAAADPQSEIIGNGRLLQAESKFVQHDFAGAIDMLKLLNPAALKPGEDWTRAHLLIQADLARNDLDSALTVATNLLQIARQGHGDVWPANLAESVSLYAGLLEQDGRPADAANAWKENLSASTPAEQQRRAIQKIVELAILQNDRVSAEAGLEGFLAQFPASSEADLALLTLGELHLKDYISRSPGTNDHLAIAQAKLDQFISTYTNSPWIGRAYLDRGWCFWEATNYPDALSDFQSAAQHPLAPEDLAVAKFKTGDSLFAVHRLPDSTNSYYSVLTDFTHVPSVTNSLVPRALYQILRVQLDMGDANGVDKTMQQFLAEFAASPQAENSLLLAGQGFSSFGEPDKARNVFMTFETEHHDSPLMPQVKFALGRTFEMEKNWPAAFTNYTIWLFLYPSNALRPQVEYARNWTVAQSGDEARALDLFTNFIGRYTNDLTPLAYWWVGDYYFRQGTNYGKAEENYEMIHDLFSTNALAAPALFMAARSEMSLGNYDQAVDTYLTRLINTTNAALSLRDQARLAYAEARRLTYVSTSDTNYAKLQDAITLLAQMYPETPTNINGALAWSETGDCDLQMGDLDGATNAYAQALAAPPATQELRNRAQVGLGIVLEKKADTLSADLKLPLLRQALNSYCNVFYNTNGVSDPIWMKEAALRALPLMSVLQKNNLDQFADRVAYWLPSMKDALDKKREALKN